mgnify:CR=1 FL=1
MMRAAILILLFVAVFFIQQAEACSCIVAGTVDTEFQEAANVVVMKLRAVEKAPEGEESHGYDGIKQSRLTVEKVFKGHLKPGQELIFAQGGGGDCVWTFSENAVGVEFLVYLGAKPARGNVWTAGTCSRSNSVMGAAADLLYLENMKKVHGKTRLSGRVTRHVASAIDVQPTTVESLSARTVFVRGNGKTIELKTDKNGVYEIYDLPPGKYQIKAESISGYKPYENENDDWSEVEIESKGHDEQDFTFRIDNAIRGRFFDATGRALKDVCLDLVPVGGTKARNFYGGDCTGADGSFEFEDVPEGTYIILVNDDGGITASEPFGSFYYPSTVRREEAGEIQVAPGTIIDNITIVAPQTAEIITVSGVLLVEEGKPLNDDFAEYAAIEFIAENDKEANEVSPSSRAQVDPSGRFTIKILKGQKGRLYGTMSAFPGKYANCPKVEKLIPKKEGLNIVDLKTPEILIIAENDQSEIELRFPFPACKNARTY